MSSEFDYQDYVSDQAFLADYNAYQKKYAERIRESDKVILGLVRDRLAARPGGAGPLRLLDVGCSTGNLLLHLKRAFPNQLALTGCDLAQSSLDKCRCNPDLNDIAFEVQDLLNLPAAGFDVITVNAVLYMMTDDQFARAFASLASALAPGGTVIVFDFFHPFPQDIAIIEKSRSHPDGLAIHFRQQGSVAKVLADAGFETPEFRPFTLPIDLPRQDDNPDLITYTVPVTDGRRLPFRGALFQPWCHMTAVRP